MLTRDRVSFEALKASVLFDEPTEDNCRHGCEEILEKLPKELQDLIVNGAPEGQRSDQFFFVVKSLKERNFSKSEILNLLNVFPEGIAEKYQERLEKEIDRAWGKPGSRDESDTFQPAWLESMNSKYFVVNESGKVLVYQPTYDYQLEREVLIRISFEDLKKLYSNEMVQAGKDSHDQPKYLAKGAAWLNHPMRRQFKGGVTFAPGKDVPKDFFNLWRGFAVKPQAGDWTLLRQHILNVICGGDKKLYAYVIGWLARLFQKPGEQGSVALVLRGSRGTGKSTLGDLILKMVGQHGLHITHAKHLVGNFNAHLRDAVFLFANEAFYAGDKQHESVLKGLVTDPFLTIEGKNKDAITARNVTHILMASNDSWVVPAGTDERRFCVLDVSDAHKNDRSYFGKLRREAESGGLSAMLFDLLHYDLSTFDVFDVPQTSALLDQKIHSLRGTEAWLFECLSQGHIGCHDWGKGERSINITTAFEDFKQFSKERREYRTLDNRIWAKQVHSLLGECIRTVREGIGVDGKRSRVWVVRGIFECRSIFSKNTGLENYDWELNEPKNVRSVLLSPVEDPFSERSANDIFS